MKMNKLLASLVVIVMVLAMVMGCSTPSATPSATPAGDANGSTEGGNNGELKDLPTMTYMYNTDAGHEVVAQTLQAMWKEVLGFNVTLENQEWATFQTARTEGNYEICRHGWLGDYVDPMTFLDMWISSSGQNDAKYKNEEYDAFIKTAKESSDTNERMTAMHDAEKLIMGDLPIIPLYHYTTTWLSHNNIEGYYFDPLLGHLIMNYASKEGDADIVYHLGATPKSIDPQLNNATDGAAIIQECFEGLTTKDAKGDIVPGMAESWTTSEDGLVWTFKLRDAKWSDGQPVKAQDFVYAWQRAVDPETACEYSYQVWYVKNGEAISNGEMDKSELGVKAVDDKTLEVTLGSPCGYFTQLTAFPTLYPVREDIVSANDAWANSPDSYICNGPFKMTKFEMGNEIVIEPNAEYWNASAICKSKVINKLTDDAGAALAAFENGEMDVCMNFDPDETQRMKDAGFFNVNATVGTYFICINLEGDQELLKEVDFRKALALAINRDELIEILQNEAIPAYGFVPPGVPDADGGDFKENSGQYFGSGDYEKDCQEARELIQGLGYKVPEA